MKNSSFNYIQKRPIKRVKIAPSTFVAICRQCRKHITEEIETEKQQSCAPGGESQSAQSAQPDQSRVEQIGTLEQVETLLSGILEYFYS